MKRYAFYLDKNNDIYAERLRGIMTDDNEEIINAKANVLMEEVNKSLKEDFKYVKLLGTFTHGNGYNYKDHKKWENECIEFLKMKIELQNR